MTQIFGKKKIVNKAPNRQVYQVFCPWSSKSISHLYWALCPIINHKFQQIIIEYWH